MIRPRRGDVLWAALSLACALLPVTVEGQTAKLESVGVTLGRADAPVVIVEYADFACSACAEFARDAWPSILRDYVETGVVRWHLVPFELGFRNSEEGIRAGMCASSLGAFWPMHDLLYERRDEWEDERRPREALITIAIDAGLDPADFEACYESDAMKDPIKAANRAARTDGIRGTPTFFVNGFRVQGALPLGVMVELIESARQGGEQPGQQRARLTSPEAEDAATHDQGRPRGRGVDDRGTPFELPRPMNTSIHHLHHHHHATPTGGGRPMHV